VEERTLSVFKYLTCFKGESLVVLFAIRCNRYVTS